VTGGGSLSLSSMAVHAEIMVGMLVNHLGAGSSVRLTAVTVPEYPELGPGTGTLTVAEGDIFPTFEPPELAQWFGVRAVSLLSVSLLTELNTMIVLATLLPVSAAGVVAACLSARVCCSPACLLLALCRWPGQLPQGWAASYDVAGCSNPAHCGTFVAVPARCTSGAACPGGAYARPGWTDATRCDGVPTYQAGGPDGPVLFRYYGGDGTYWDVGSSDRLNDCEYGHGDYLSSAGNPGLADGAPTAPVYSAGSGYYDRDNHARGTITVTAGDGSAIGGGGGH
jgi:hypothetical protein